MLRSFEKALQEGKSHFELPRSSHYPKGYGIVYIEELNVWGTVLEFIAGNPFPKAFKNQAESIKLMQSVLLGLKELDEAGHPFTDLKPDNIIVRDDGTAVIVDDVSYNCEDPALSLWSRREFGTMLYNAVTMEDQLSNPEIPSTEWRVINRDRMLQQLGPLLTSLLLDCWSDRSIHEFGWNEIDFLLSQWKPN